ncbi:MAG: NrdH-redoxin [Burkholderiaceae bacterium]|jgi:glutaredoxin|nr:MAG: NrdH-redoxin [Burkholderiaceae bacterium]
MRQRIWITFVLAASALLVAGSASAQTGNNAGNGPLPYAVAQAAQRYPVTLYASSNCSPCDSARAFLNQRGIPFVEKTISSNADLAALKDLTHATNVPALTIGTQSLDGFSSSAWSQYLDAAGYPKTSQLPAGWQNGAASPLAPSQPADVTPGANATQAAGADNAPATTEPPVKPEPSATNPAGIRF